MRLVAIACTMLLLAPTLSGCARDADGGVESIEWLGLVVASHPTAAAAGVEVLRAGGNAVDAAAAVQWALGVVEPQFSGLGGGAFILIHNQTSGTTVALDGREVAPASARPDQFLLPTGQPQPSDHAETRGYAVGVPGTLRVWSEAVVDHGRLPLARTMEPAARIAEEGFPVDEYLARYLANDSIARKLKSWPPSARMLYHDVVCPPDAGTARNPAGCIGGTPLAAGETLANPDLARTLRRIQAEGPDAFYAGEVAAAIADTVAQRGGRMMTSDLASYEVVERPPLVGRYRDVEIVTMPAPGGGPILLHMLGLLEGFDLRAGGHNAPDTLHRFVEAQRLAYADRAAHMGDPAFADVPQAGLLHPDYVAQRRALIDPQRANPDVRAGDPWAYQNRSDEGGGNAENGATATPHARDEAHTSHIVVIDRDGLIVTSSTTIESHFGTGLLVPGHGFFLNNQLTDFDFVPGGPNEVAPGKRPRSSMSPSILLRDGTPFLVVGASGGARIVPGVAQVILNVVDHELSLGAAVEAPRVHAPTYPVVHWDRALPESTREALAARGHAPEATPHAGIAQVEIAMRVEEGWIGAADTRSAPGGVAAAFTDPA